jgi:ATP-dependent protease ClpP protease subunit
MEIVDLQDLLKSSIEINTLPEPSEYQYFKGLANRRLIINDEISDTIIDRITLPFMEMDNDGTGDPIEIILNTYGGDIYSGFNFIDMIEKAKSPVTIHIMGMAASMGILIAMAGKNNPNVKTVCHSFSVGLLHSGSQYM